jgi:hypothetical protein
LMSFIRGVARHVVSEKQKRAKELSLHDVPEPVHRTANEEREQEMDRRARCLKESLPRLDPADRELVLGWYAYEKGSRSANIRRLADLRGTSPATLRVQAHRARRRLYRLVEDCLKKKGTEGVSACQVSPVPRNESQKSPLRTRTPADRE